MKKPLRLVVLLSGDGSIFEAIVEAIEAQRLNAEILMVMSDNPNAYGLTRARLHNLNTHTINVKEYSDTNAFQRALKEALVTLKPDFIVLSGFMRILAADIIQAFPKRILNIHPSLLPQYPGLHTHERVLAAGDKKHGTTVHFVDEGLDSGPIIAQRELTILPEDTAESLQQRVKELEKVLYPEVLQRLADRL
ncbi:MAG: phosphoribosylglycinamide formyltransferase [Gammaproteobacteria bacterium]|jgi:phosphoribosylglycinamide formyltransferase-1|nr:phosphoribosylglycinamide formyltransferase [Gammaproteobacteria bacterium]